MIIAIPCSTGRLSQHFGYCDTFAFVTVDDESKTIEAIEEKTPPPHVPGAFPKWLSENGTDLVFTNCLGTRAIKIFETKGIDYQTGVPVDKPRALVERWLAGDLETGPNTCTHD